MIRVFISFCIELTKKKYLLISFIFILIISYLGFSIVYEGNLVKQVEKIRIIKHMVNFFWIVIIAIIGAWGWNKTVLLWPYKIWYFIYISSIILFIFFGIIDLLFGGLNFTLRVSLGYFHMFLQSPMPFIVLWILLKFNN